jgi:putative ABC transport system permease protein
MSEQRWLGMSERWLRLLLWLYPADFREEMGEEVVEAYRDRCRAALRRGGILALGWVWLRALADSVRNGLGERVWPAVSWRRTGRWGRDTERVLRRLTRAPVFVLTMVGTLGVGLGAFAVVFTAVDRVLLAPLPYENPDDLYFVWREYGWFDLDRGWLGGPDIVELDQAGGPVEAVVGMSRGLTTLAATAGAEPEEIPFIVSSPELFDVLGVQPMLGRTFRPEEVGPEREPVIVLGHDLWRTRFGGDPGVVGSTVQAGATQYTVIGVMPPGFRFRMHSSLGAPLDAEAYITFSVNLAEMSPGSGSYAGLLRARPGSSPEAVASTVAAVGSLIDERDMEGRGLRLYPVGMKEDLVARVRPALTVLGLAGVFLVLVLMVNLANLLLVRAAQREREFAISRALGSNRLALMRAMFLEGGILGMLGGAAGALLAVWGTRLLVSLAPADLPRRETIALDWRIAAIVIGVGLIVGLLAAALPAIWATRAQLSTLLANTAVRGGGGGSGRARRVMVVVQVALSLVLLSAGALVVRSFESLLRTDPGFQPEGVLTFRVPIPTSGYPEMEDATALQRRIREELSALPGVRAVGATNSLPLASNPSQTTFEFPGAPGLTGDPDHDAPLTDWTRITPGYLEAMGIRVLSGRGFEDSPREGLEVLIDRTLAQHFFPGADPLGFRIPAGDGEHSTIVGVVEHARFYDVHQDGRPQLYVSLDQMPLRSLYWTVRTTRDPSSLAPEVRSAIRRLDPGLAISELRPMEQVVSESVSQQRLSAVLIAGFALGALLLAAMGLFGVVAGSVTHRRHELAVRLALGADHGRALRLVLGEGARLILLGLFVGVPGIYFAGQTLRGVLVGISPFDPLTLVATAAGLAALALVACYVPARRVTTIEPAGLLRQE